MKPPILLFILFFLETVSLGQNNNILRGKVFYLNSGKKPAVGVEISGTIQDIEHAQIVYTTESGAYQLIFPTGRDGYAVKLLIGNKDSNGNKIELVNDKEVKKCLIPAIVSNEFEIIVCKKGERDIIAQRYYKIIKSSSDFELAKKEKDLQQLLSIQKKNYKEIADLTNKIVDLQKETDSLTIYKEAFSIASINKDNASIRVLNYISLLDDGKSIREARKALNIQAAAKELNEGVGKVKQSIEELERRAGASLAIYDYNDAIMCYDTIIFYSENLNIDKRELANLYSKIGKVYNSDGQYAKALKYQEKCLSIRNEILEPNHPDILTSYYNISSTYRLKGQYTKALEYGLKDIEILENYFDSKNLDLSNSYHNIALTYLALKQRKIALDYILKSIEIKEEILPHNHPDLASSYSITGPIYLTLGEYSKALDLNKKSISIQEETLNPKHPDLLSSYNNIASTYRALGEYEKSLEYSQKAIHVLEEILSPNHPDLAILYNNIASTYKSIREFDKALEYNQKSIRIQEEKLEPKHRDLGESYYLTASIYRAMGEYEQALIYYHKDIAIQEEILPPLHPELAATYNYIASTYNAIGQYDKALEFKKKCIEIRERQLDLNDLDLGYHYYSIANTYMKLKEFDKAIENQQKCLTIFENSLPANDPDLQKALNQLVRIYEAKGLDFYYKGEYTIALDCFNTVGEHRDNGHVHFFKGSCYYYLGDYPNAIEYFKSAGEIIPDIKTQTYYNNIGMAYCKNKQFNEAYIAFTENEKLYPNEGKTFRNWAMYFAIQDDKEKAIQNLQKAISLGYDDKEWLITDGSMENLKENTAFIEIIESISNK